MLSSINATLNPMSSLRAPLRRFVASQSRRLAVSSRSMSGLAPTKTPVDPGVLPEMQLSTNGNPLTAPICMKDFPLAERAAKRFAVEGNAIVTGGVGFIGLASARSILEHGASGVCLFDMDYSLQARESDVEKLRADYPDRKIITEAVDVTDADAVSSSVAKAKEQLGSIDHMLCFAGIVATIPATDMTPQNWRKVLDINISGSWYCAQAAARHMIEQKSGGSIMFTASISAHLVNFPQPQAQHGIRVNSLSPGYMDTVLTMLNDGKGLEVGKEIWEKRNPMGRMGTPEELTGAVVLFTSKIGGRYLTGEDIKVDGGQTVF